MDESSFDSSLLDLKSYGIKGVSYSLHDANDDDIVIGLVCRLNNVIDKKIISRFQNLKFIASVTTGSDHIDLDFCEKNKIKVITLKDEIDFLSEITPTPELTWGLIITITRRIIKAHASVVDGKWNRANYFSYSLKGRTIGIVGCGRVGKIVAGYAEAFGMNILYSDLDPTVRCPSQNANRVKIEELMEKSDVITLHFHHNPDNDMFISKRLLSKIKQGSSIVNTSRGACIDEDAISLHLRSGRLFGYACDSISGENFESIRMLNPIVKAAREGLNVVITPHIGGSTYDAFDKTNEHIVGMIRKFLVKNLS